MEPAPQFHSFSNSATLSNWNCHQLRGVTQKDKMSPNVISVSTRAAPPPWQAPTEHQSQIQPRPTLCLRLHPTASRWPIWNKEREEKAIYFHTTPYDVRLDKKKPSTDSRQNIVCPQTWRNANELESLISSRLPSFKNIIYSQISSNIRNKLLLTIFSYP